MYCEHLLKYKQDFTHSDKISPKLDAILNSETTEQIQKTHGRKPDTVERINSH